MKVKFVQELIKSGITGDKSDLIASIIKNNINNQMPKSTTLQEIADHYTEHGRELHSSIKNDLNSFDLTIEASEAMSLEHTQLMSDSNWDGYYNHTYELKFKILSLPYEVVKIIDSNNYLLVDPHTNEIILYKFKPHIKVYRVD